MARCIAVPDEAVAVAPHALLPGLPAQQLCRGRDLCRAACWFPCFGREFGM